MKGFEKATLIEKLMREKSVEGRESELRKRFDLLEAERSMCISRMQELDKELSEIRAVLEKDKMPEPVTRNLLDALAIELFHTDFHKVMYADYETKLYLKESLFIRNIMDVYTYPNCGVHEVVCRPYNQESDDKKRRRMLENRGYVILHETSTRYLIRMKERYEMEKASGDR